MVLAGHWLRLQGSRGPASGFLYSHGALERPTRRLAIFQELRGAAAGITRATDPASPAFGYPYVSRGPRPLTVRPPFRQLGAAGPRT
jgi:hypothetical protein